MYKNLSELPDAVKALPEHAQQIFMAAFNSAFEQYEGDPSDAKAMEGKEEKCFAIAWAAVKNKYEKKGRQPSFRLGEPSSSEREASGPEGDEWVKIEAKNIIPVFALKEIASDAPSEFQLLPDGEIELEGDLPAFLDQEAADLILQRQAKRKKDIVIDYEHQTLKDVQAPASGWIKKLIYKGKEGLWAVVEWTNRGKEYIQAKEYRYFSPVMWIRERDRKVVGIDQVALTNAPVINNLQPIVAKLGAKQESDSRLDDEENLQQKGKEEKLMLEKLKKLLGLAADAAEAKVEEAVQLLVNKVKSSETIVACKEVLEAVGAKAEATKDEVIQIVASLKAPADVAKTLSLEVADLRKQLQEIKQTDLVQLALKEGKTSPEEIDKWGRDLALKSPEQFKLIVLSRPAGSVIPIGGIPPEGPARNAGMDDVQKSINKMMGVSDETWKKYNVKQ